MVSLESNNVVDGFNLDKTRLSLYYEKYQYKASCELYGIGYFRNHFTRYGFQECLRREVWFRHSTRRRKVTDIINAYDPTAEAKILQFINDFEKNRDLGTQFLVRTYHNYVDVYSNDTAFLKNLGTYLNDPRFSYVKPHENFQRDTIYQVNPKHKFRIYFKWVRLDSPENIKFRDFVDKHEIYPSPSLSRSMANYHTKDSYTYLHEGMFVDIDHDGIITIMALTFPDIIRKVCKIEKR